MRQRVAKATTPQPRPGHARPEHAPGHAVEAAAVLGVAEGIEHLNESKKTNEY